MKTILDNKEFRKAFKKRCREEHLVSFYWKSLIANLLSFRKEPIACCHHDMGDEVYNSAYSALEDIGYIDKVNGIKISPYDILHMSCKRDTNSDNEVLEVEFKRWCPNFGMDRSDRIVCNVMPEMCGQYVNCGKFYCAHYYTVARDRGIMG